jgi:hypothetical protein
METTAARNTHPLNRFIAPPAERAEILLGCGHTPVIRKSSDPEPNAFSFCCVNSIWAQNGDESMKAVGIFALALVIPAFASAQSSSARARTDAITASFNKFKHEVKEKRGVRLEKYKRVVPTPVVKSDPRGYSGSYEAETFGYTLDLTVDSRGNVTGSGYQPLDIDGSVRKRFTLRDGRVDGALFTATKVFQSGATQRIEGVFMNRTAYESPTDKTGRTTFGLGVEGNMIDLGQYAIDQFFFTRK